MKRPVTLLLAIIVVAACTSASPPSASPSATVAPPTAAPPATAAPSTPQPTAAPTAEPTAAGPTPPATLTPTTPDPDGSMVATWWLDPASLPVDPQATQLRGFVLERECASGQSPEGRIVRPDVDYGAEALTITFSITPLPGGQDCQANTPFGVVFELEDAVDGRPILDGGTVPARDATSSPAP
jgi:pyruvate/2-oxoglutarate dehydrogenase complex dihydrolipoamide acyltransferase (E2) component